MPWASETSIELQNRDGMAVRNSNSNEYRRWIAGLAKNLRAARLRKDLSQEEVAAAAQISVNTYARLERENVGPLPNPTLHTVMRIFSVLDLRAADPSLEPDDSASVEEHHWRS